MLCECIGIDPEDVIRNAFASFDEEGTGKIHEDRVRELLTTMGDCFTDAQVCGLCVSGFYPEKEFGGGGRGSGRGNFIHCVPPPPLSFLSLFSSFSPCMCPSMTR